MLISQPRPCAKPSRRALAPRYRLRRDPSLTLNHGQFARFLYRENYLLLDIAEGFETPKGNDSLPRQVVSEREAVALMNAPDVKTPVGLRDRAILEIFYGTAIRNSELRMLTLDQVDREHAQLRIEHGKGDKGRVVPLGEEAQAWLEHYLRLSSTYQTKFTGR